MASQKMLNKIEQLKKGLEVMISNDDFNKFFENVQPKILKYSELANFETMTDLLPENRDYKIILTESSRGCGHWCCIMRYDNTFEWFDSYGVKPDGELNFIAAGIKKMLGEDKHHLSRLIKTIKAPNKFIYNKTKFQVLKEGINSCGRWTISRLKTFQIGYDLKEFQDFINKFCINNDCPPDVGVVLLTS